ncbi:low molecular weight protein-tyrosine-phosphatase [Streptomyces alkaliphilus]|uniref:low molecular weight protein-tyrosine-phosphatase n=1 Tax=Streptomyces alkaliphilus TaxID=1472722 RepID=UPI0034D2F6FA
MRVCFVCTGNICRSPMAAAVLRRRLAEDGLADRVVVESAGTDGWHTGDPADTRAVATLLASGYDAGHAARRFEAEEFPHHDLVVALDTGHLRRLRALAPASDGADPGPTDRIRLLRSFDPSPEAERSPDVPDPYWGDAEAFEECLEMIEAAMPGLLATIRELIADRAGTPRRA